MTQEQALMQTLDTAIEWGRVQQGYLITASLDELVTGNLKGIIRGANIRATFNTEQFLYVIDMHGTVYFASTARLQP